ncbi:hypothetical protein BW733_03930 [Tessaracoccus flavescens]|uniref:Integrase SAM-like N-terminal domain-containing protein n=1 Tax=Tessaracoccus flavescens TaxID=399497 RepID=A0A1Q2CVI2_9ACTN|nr:hypothetical protein BW733_03930 [Tessaracoccus flavescens]
MGETLRPSPYPATASYVRRWIVPTLGHKKLDQLTPPDLRPLGRACLAAGLARATAAKVTATLQLKIREAISDGLPRSARTARRQAPLPCRHEVPHRHPARRRPALGGGRLDAPGCRPLGGRTTTGHAPGRVPRAQVVVDRLGRRHHHGLAPGRHALLPRSQGRDVPHP